MNGALITNLIQTDPLNFLENAQSSIFKFIRRKIAEPRCIKVNATLSGLFSLANSQDEKHFSTRCKEIFTSTDLNSWYNDEIKEKILSQIEDFESQAGSG